MRRRLLDDQGCRHASNQRLEANRDHSNQRERGQGWGERAREVRHREAGDSNRDQAPAPEAVSKRRQRERSECPERKHGPQVGQPRNLGVEVGCDRRQRQHEHRAVERRQDDGEPRPEQRSPLQIIELEHAHVYSAG